MQLYNERNTIDIQSKKNRALYVILSFFLPMVIISIALAWLHITPFGDKTLVISDANGLYINYLAYVGRMAKGIEGFAYSFEKGLGGNMLPNIGITMLNPFFLIFSLFGIRDYPFAFTLVCICNCSFSGLTMYLLMAHLYGQKQSNLIFSTTYALIGFNVANVFQVFFFAGVHMLPLMILGLHKLLQDNSPLLYILALGYAILTSYYFGFMLCVASVLFFSLYIWEYHQKLNEKKKLLKKYVLSSFCGGLLGMMIWLPALLGIRGGRLEQTTITEFSFQENMPLLDIGAKLFTGANNLDELIDGLPNIYVGILPLALVVLFFMNGDIVKRKKTAAGIAVSFYLLSFYIVAFNMLMHGGTVTNWFNFRYSFVFSFLLLLIAAEQWQYIDRVNFKNCTKCFFILLIGTVLVFSKSYSFVKGGAVILDFAILLIMYLALYMFHTNREKNPKRIFELLILLVCSFQMALNFYISTGKLLKTDTWYLTVSDYQETVDNVAPLVSGLRRGDSEFYRMEVNKQRSGNCGNDPMLYGYYGVGHSGSYERSFVRTELAKLGIHWFQTRNYYWEGIPSAVDALLGIRYLLAQENLNLEKGYQGFHLDGLVDIAAKGKEHVIYYNPDSLSIAFLADHLIDTIKTDYTDVFDNLNRTWNAISGKDKPVFVEEDDITFQAHNMFDYDTLSAKDAKDIVQKYDVEEQEASVSALTDELLSNQDPPEYVAYIEYNWTAKQDGAIYCYNRGIMDETQGTTTPILEYIGNYKKGDTVTGYIRTSVESIDHIAFEEICGRFRAAYADDDALHELATIVKSRPCTIEKVKDTHLYGDFTAEAGQELMFTIPYDEGWTCYVDGEKVPINMVLGVFMSVDVPEGTHSYEMKFFPTGMKTGIGISAAALLTTIVYIPVDTKRRKRQMSIQAEVQVDEPISAV